MPGTGSESASLSSENRPSMDLAGRQLGGYLLLRRLGKGAMAEVYLAQQLSLQRLVAVKILKPHLAEDPQYVRRFHVEAQSAAGLSHPNIVQIYEVGCQEGWHYIVQEYVPGRNLKELLERQGPLSPAMTVHIIRRIAAALVRSGEQGIVHRDIKPENVMLSGSGEVKVADFGLARMADVNLELTQDGITMGTPLYMSPEQVQGKPLDTRSDIYSLGVTAYHMLAGRPPFSADHAMGVAFQHVKEEPPPLEQVREGIPEQLVRVIHRMLQKRPEDRYQSASALAADLRTINVAGEDGDSDGPPELALDFSPFADSTTPGQLAATQELRVAMARSEKARSRSGGLLSATLLVVAGLALGILAGIITREPALVDPRPGTQTVPRKDNAWEQLFHAKYVDRESAWLSVKEYFPDDAVAGRLADEGLVMFYLERQQWPRAIPILEEWFVLDPNLSNQTFGLAGLFVAYAHAGNREDAEYVAVQLDADILSRLDSDYPVLSQMFWDAWEDDPASNSDRESSPGSRPD